MTTNMATQALESIPPQALVPYHDYFDSLRPKSDEELFRRGLFAHASVHTTWQKNVDMYALLWDLGWRTSRADLKARLAESRAGLTNNRTKYIWEFNQRFWADPSFYRKKGGESWVEFRGRVEKATIGLGHAKTSFFIEMTYFQDARVVCGDTHQLQLFGLKGNQSPGRRIMDQVESHWVAECERLNLPPVTARWYLWDRKQNRPDSRYWSYVLEGGKPDLMLPRQLEFWPYRQFMAA